MVWFLKDRFDAVMFELRCDGFVSLYYYDYVGGFLCEEKV